MEFGEIPTADAEGAILAHSVSHTKGVFKKGRWLTASDIVLLAESGISKVFAARLGGDDVPEDDAAQALATRICGANVSSREPFTGRVNLYADQRGLAVLDMARVNALNRVHESVTLATVGYYSVVDPQQIIATVLRETYLRFALHAAVFAVLMLASAILYAALFVGSA